MREEKRNTFFRNVFLAVWAMFTLVLLFSLVLLVDHMLSRGDNPFSPPKSQQEESPVAAAPPTSGSQEMREIVLYYADADGNYLVAEKRRLPFSEYTVDNCRRALEALRAPSQQGFIPVLPASAKIRGLFLRDDELVVDFSRELELDAVDSASAEGLMVYAIVNTLTQGSIKGIKENGVRKVRILVEGAVPSESFPSHMDLTFPVAADPYWIKPEGEAEGHA